MHIFVGQGLALAVKTIPQSLRSLRFTLVTFLAQGKVSLALGHRKRGLMRLLTSSLQGIINALLDGQLVPLRHS